MREIEMLVSDTDKPKKCLACDGVDFIDHEEQRPIVRRYPPKNRRRFVVEPAPRVEHHADKVGVMGATPVDACGAQAQKNHVTAGRIPWWSVGSSCATWGKFGRRVQRTLLRVITINGRQKRPSTMKYYTFEVLHLHD